MIVGDYFLVWDPGVGKTLPVIEAADYLSWEHEHFDSDAPHQTLCVVPASIREQWKEKFNEQTPWLSVTVLETLNKKITREQLESDVVICSYEYMACLARWKQLRRHLWAALAVDECHYLIYEEAARTRAMLGADENSTDGLAFAAERTWWLSGTPFTFPHQIYPILSRIFPAATKRNGEYMTAAQWQRRFCDVAPNSFGRDKVVGAINVPELRKRVHSVIDRVRLEDAVDMPPLTVDKIPIKATLTKLLSGLDDELLAQYQALIATLEDDEIPDAKKLTALEDSGLDMAQLRHSIAVTKIKSAVEIIKMDLASGTKKLLVFGWHTEPINELGRLLKSPVYTGKTPKAKRRQALERFLDDDKTKVLIAQIGAVGTGTDGIQDVCHRSMFFETSWRYIDNKQAIHRTYRNGQKLPCHASVLSLVGSVDDYVAKIITRNAKTINSVLD